MIDGSASCQSVLHRAYTSGTMGAGIVTPISVVGRGSRGSGGYSTRQAHFLSEAKGPVARCVRIVSSGEEIGGGAPERRVL